MCLQWKRRGYLEEEYSLRRIPLHLDVREYIGGARAGKGREKQSLDKYYKLR
jgi:hypothetical protein